MDAGSQGNADDEDVHDDGYSDEGTRRQGAAKHVRGGSKSTGGASVQSCLGTWPRQTGLGSRPGRWCQRGTHLWQGRPAFAVVLAGVALQRRGGVGVRAWLGTAAVAVVLAGAALQRTGGWACELGLRVRALLWC